ncbi:MAG: SusC/RagA family protein, partial [Tidjanibacter sp.]|nr:SusC/RagA family protein [Tidjanibacter sp.]
GYRYDGFYTVDDFNLVDGKWVLKEGVADASEIVGANYMRPGARKFKDLSGDGKITTDNADKDIIGNALPDWTGGLIISGWIGNFDYSANFNGVFGNQIYNANKIEFTSTRKYNYRNLLSTMTVENRWTNVDWTTGELVNDPDKLAEMNAGKTEGSPMIYNAAFSDDAVEDGSFVRLASVTLGYTFPEKLTKRAGIQSLRIYATGSNLFCWTNYSGYDPEVDSRRSTPLTPGVDYSAYPKSRGVVFGLNLTF